MKPHKINYKLAVSVGIILVFGLVMLTSASQVLGLDTYNDPYFHIKHQLIFGFLPGVIILLITAHIPYTFFRKIAFPLFLLSILLLILVFIPSLSFSHGGARRWIYLGSLSIQPAEIVKLSLIIFLAHWFAKKKAHLQNLYYTLLPFLAYLGIIIVLVTLQPDIGTLAVIVMIAGSMYFVAGIKPSHLAGTIALGAIGFFILIKIAPYRLNRITVFLNPDQDTLGIGYQIHQSLLAIGSGGALGLGLGQSKQKYQYLPEVAGDSIFAVIAEELGFLLTSLFIGLYLYFIMQGFIVASKSKDDFAKYMATGITVWFAFQSLVNMGAMVNLLPLTGLPLPLVSYGSSALLVSMASLGILLNISRYTK
jgi:cell division protein FtsW